MTDLILEAIDLRKTFAGPSGSKVEAVDGVSLKVEPEQFLALRGPSGCGKSTLLFMVGGLLRPDSGEVRITGESLYEKGASRQARVRAQQVGFVFQQFHLVPYLNSLENVLAPTLALPVSNAVEKAEGLLETFGLSDRLDHVPANLSVGEQQRVALARALLLEPKLLLADEPTGNLDPENAEAILVRLSAFAKQGGAVIMVTHDDRAAEHATRSILMEKGQLNKITS